MTTIATDGKSLAGDGRSCVMDRVTNNSLCKVHRLKDGCLAGYAGTTADGLRFLEWLESGGKLAKLDPEFQGLTLAPDGTVRYYAGGLDNGEQEAPAAIGSGGEIAIGAMLAGKGAKAAVEIAAQRDPFTGGKITVLAL